MTEIKAKGTVIFLTSIIEEHSTKRRIICTGSAYKLDISEIIENDYDVIFRKDEAVIIDRDGNSKLIAKRHGGLYYIHEDY